MNADELLDRAEFFRGIGTEPLSYLASIAEECRFSEGDIVFDEDADADSFYICTAGRIGLELTAAARPPVVIQTLGPGDLVGLSWLFPPHRWNWRARALVDTSGIVFDASATRQRMSRDPELRHERYELVAKEALRRLHSSRAQLLNLYETGV